MSLTAREFWTVIHGMILGTLFLLAFAGGLAGLWSLRPEWVTVAGMRERLRRLHAGTWIMAVVAWLTVITGTYIVYPWYRAKPPEGTTDLSQFPRSYLLADLNLTSWHTFGMEWKEHVGWFAPILATAAAFIVTYYGASLAEKDRLRKAVLVLFTIAFAASAVAGLFGAFLNKVAPIR
jgi:hypothetical protein